MTHKPKLRFGLFLCKKIEVTGSPDPEVSGRDSMTHIKQNPNIGRYWDFYLGKLKSIAFKSLDK